MWTPHEVRKLLAQVAGLIFGVAGVWLIVSGVQATGKLDISSSVLSGKLESGSAGLFLVFLGFLLILFPALSSGGPLAPQRSRAQKELEPKDGVGHRYAIATVGFLLFSAVLLLGGHYLEETLQIKVGAFFQITGGLLGILSGLMLIVGVLSWTGAFTGAFDDASNPASKKPAQQDAQADDPASGGPAA